MTNRKIQCPHCARPVEMDDSAESIVCAGCGHLILIERVQLNPAQMNPPRAASEKDAPALPADRAAAAGVFLMIAAFGVCLAGLSLHIFWLWIASIVFFIGGVIGGALGLKGNLKERVGAVAIVGFIALFFIITGFTQTW